MYFRQNSHGFSNVLDDARMVCYVLVNTSCFLTEMHGLLSLGVRPIHVERMMTLKAIRYFSKTTAFRCQVKVDKDVKSLIEKAAKKMDPFSSVQNEPITNFKHHMGFHGFELYPIQGQVIAWAIILVLIAYYACAKIEIVMDRSYKNTPFTWGAMKNGHRDYVAFGFKREPVPRLDLMETLQEEMIEEARRRGTRK
ncbi:unnamed protein product [Litomosoides sigmodontis]|uniref:Uncharacterized protein n=1 Tax=Litomosoides sigmodontis TaxID=42156 RepID=A0A3P6TVB8_LITSI|nr:unnamed protein product [Litomosoides sigmodontis]